MSVRKRYIRGSRILYLLRPDPFVPPPLIIQLWRLLRNPARGVDLIMRSAPGLRRLAAAVGAAGALAGALTWLAFRSAATPALLLQAPAWALLGGAAAAGAAWIALAGLLHGSGYLLGGLGPFRQTLQVTGVALLPAPLLLLLSMPGTTIGAALCALIAGWLAAVSYHLERRVLRLLPAGAGLAAAVPALLLLVGAASWSGWLLRLIPLRFIGL